MEKLNGDHQENEAEDARLCGEAGEEDDEGKAWTGTAAQDVKNPRRGRRGRMSSTLEFREFIHLAPIKSIPSPPHA